MDFDVLYNEAVDKVLSQLKNEFEESKNRIPELREELKVREFQNNISKQITGLYENWEKTSRNSANRTEYNKYIEEIIKEFEKIVANKKYIGNVLSNFLKFDLPELKKHHFDIFESGQKGKDYTFMSDFVNNGSNEEIIEILAKNHAYRTFYIELDESLRVAPAKNDLKGIIAIEPLEWLGTQNQLAELIIMLKVKGWIKDIKKQTIKKCFTNTNSIEQKLDPCKDGNGFSTYKKLNTKRHTWSFDGMKDILGNEWDFNFYLENKKGIF